MVWHESTYIVPQDRSFQGTLCFFGQVDSVPWGFAVMRMKVILNATSECFLIGTIHKQHLPREGGRRYKKWQLEALFKAKLGQQEKGGHLK